MNTEEEQRIIDEEERAVLILSRAERLAEALRRRIIAGGVQPNVQLAPMRTLALQFGISRLTLSEVAGRNWTAR